MDNFKSILPGGKPTNKNALSNMGKSVGGLLTSFAPITPAAGTKIGADMYVQNKVNSAYKSRQAAKKAAQILSTYSSSSIAKNPNSIFMQQAQAGNRNPNTTMQVTPVTLNKVIKTDAQILAEQNARIAANQPKTSTAPVTSTPKSTATGVSGGGFSSVAPKSTATGISGGGFTASAPKKTTPAAPMASNIKPYDYAAANAAAAAATSAAANNRVVAQPQAGTLTVRDAFAGIPQVDSDNMRYAEINALSLQKQYEDDLNAQITAQNLYTSGQNEYATRQNIYQTNLAAEKEASDESTALKNYIEDQRIANLNAQVAANYATQPDFIDNRNMSEYETPSQPLVVPYTNRLSQSSLMAGLQNDVAPQQQNLADAIPQQQVIENIFASGLPTGAIPTLQSNQEASIAAEAARVAALEADKLRTPTSLYTEEERQAEINARAKVANDELVAEKSAVIAKIKADSDAAAASSEARAAKAREEMAAINAKAEAFNKEQKNAAEAKAAYDKEVADLAARNAANVSKLTAVSNTNKVGLREALSRGMMLASGRAADVYGGRAPALLGQMVTGQQRAFTKGLGAENASFLDQYANLNQSYIDALNAYNEQEAIKKAARAKQIADAASIRSTLGMGA
jgi:hypothetical protein